MNDFLIGVFFRVFRVIRGEFGAGTIVLRFVGFPRWRVGLTRSDYYPDAQFLKWRCLRFR